MTNKLVKSNKNKHIIPGFGLSMGITISMLSLIVLIPLATIILYTAKLSPAEFIGTITRPRLLASLELSLSCSLCAAAVNLVMGIIIAWVMVRYDFPGKRILDGLIELPFALPTAVAGISLTSLTVNTGWVGGIFARFGISIAYTRIGIIIALIFVGIPFVARTVEPVLEKLDPTYEEAAGILGASKIKIFFNIILPEITPAALTGFGLAFARNLGEYGSVVFIAGNQPYKTEIVPLLIFAQLQEYDYAEATAIALLMLIIAFLLLFIINLIQNYAAKRTDSRSQTEV
jgi:sulfate ABC transporter, permease protein CysT